MESNVTSLKQKTIIITGGSRGIGQAIALKLAASGMNLVILSKDFEENIQQTASQINSLGANALVLNLDVTDCTAIKEAVATVIEQFGSIDALINNTSAACFQDVLNLSSQQFDLMMATSVRSAFFLSQTCIPYFKKTSNPHIINISPPLNMDPHWFKNYLGFSISKYAMSMCTLGMAETFKMEKIAVNSLWPKSTIATQTLKKHFSSKVYESSRKPSIMADAAYQLLLRESSQCTGQFFIDEDLLKNAGVNDF